MVDIPAGPEPGEDHGATVKQPETTDRTEPVTMEASPTPQRTVVRQYQDPLYGEMYPKGTPEGLPLWVSRMRFNVVQKTKRQP